MSRLMKSAVRSAPSQRAPKAQPLLPIIAHLTRSGEVPAGEWDNALASALRPMLSLAPAAGRRVAVVAQSTSGAAAPLSPSSRLIYRLGEDRLVLSPLETCLVLPAGWRVLTAADGNRLMIGFAPAADSKPLPSSGNIALFVDVPQGHHPVVDELWVSTFHRVNGEAALIKGAGFSLRPPSVAPASPWSVDEVSFTHKGGHWDTGGVADHAMSGERRWLQVAVEQLRGAPVVLRGEPTPAHWFAAEWSTPAGKDAEFLQNQLRLNTILMTDTVAVQVPAADLRWCGSTLTLPACRSIRGPQAVSVLEVVDSARGVRYVDERLPTGGMMPTYRVQPATTPGGQGTLLFDAPISVSLRLAYRPATNIGPLDPRVQLEPEQATQPHVRGTILHDRSWDSDLTDGELAAQWAQMFMSANRCPTPRDLRLAVMSFDLFGINSIVDAAQVRVRDRYRRGHQGLRLYQRVTVPLLQHNLAAARLEMARLQLQKHLTSLGAGSVRVQWEVRP